MAKVFNWKGRKKEPYETYEPGDQGGNRGKNSKKKIAWGIGIGGAAVAAMLFFSDCWYSIEEEQQAVVCTLGKPAAVTEPGLHFKIPLIQTVQKVNTTIQGFAIGWESSRYERGETDLSEIDTGEESLMITSDYNFINIDFYVEYRYSDPVKAVYASRNPEGILNNVAQNCIRTVIGSYPVDAVLTTGKNEIQANIKEMLMQKLEEIDIGIQLINITIQDAEPPTNEVMTAFKEVETAKQGKDTAVNNANKYRNEQIPAAQAKADQILQDAQAQKEERINEAEGQVARFNSMYEEYVKYPAITKQRMFYEAMEDILPELKVVITDGEQSSVQSLLPLDSFSQGSEAQQEEKEANDGDQKSDQQEEDDSNYNRLLEDTEGVW